MVWAEADSNGNVSKQIIKVKDISNEETLKKLGLSSKNDLKITELKLVPNKDSGKFELSFKPENKKKIEITVFDSNLKSVFNNKLKAQEEYKIETPITVKTKGTFYISITGNKKTFSKQIVID